MPAKPQACDACHKPGFGARMIPFWQGATRTMYASLSAELAASARAGVQDTPALATAREMLSRISQDGSWGVHNPGETWRLLGKVRECIHGAEQNREQIQ
jgi:hypothetical protein